jgi:hypothetical protein
VLYVAVPMWMPYRIGTRPDERQVIKPSSLRIPAARTWRQIVRHFAFEPADCAIRSHWAFVLDETADAKEVDAVSFCQRFDLLVRVPDPGHSAGEALFVLHLMSFKWNRELPYPTYKTIAKRMGITDKMARRYAQSLDRKGYLRRRYQTKAANRFDLTGLFKALAVAPPEDSFYIAEGY